jgi:protein FAM50
LFSSNAVGNASDAAKIRRLEEQRRVSALEVEKQKEKLAVESDKSHIVAFASSKSEAIDAAASAASVGLQTKAQFAEKRAAVKQTLEAEAKARETADETLKAKEKDKKRKKQKKDAKAKLSFADDEEEFGGEDCNDASASAKRTKFATVGKNPTVDTNFLPDRDRENAELAEREGLKMAYVERTNRVKAELLEITFSYWDGGGHRRKCEVLKGDTIGAFLGKARDALSGEFRELRHATGDGLMYIKEDLIMPHNVSFHDLIVNKARGKSGPLFHFDVHDDVRVMGGGAAVEKDESHAGKVIHRTWYDKNKHIFPASRWEVWEPGKSYGGYTIHGSEVNG